jgi:hypothetical protein
MTFSFIIVFVVVVFIIFVVVVVIRCLFKFQIRQYRKEILNIMFDNSEFEIFIAELHCTLKENSRLYSKEKNVFASFTNIQKSLDTTMDGI